MDDWNKYKVAIDAVSASITYVHPDKGEKNFKVYANDPRRSYASSNPETTLGDALKLVLDAEVVDGKFLIDGEEVNNDWRIFMLSENDDDYDILQQADDLFEIELRPDMDIIIEKTDLNGSPFVQYAFYEEGGKRVVASIFENGSSIDYVKAKVRTITGEAKTIDLIDEDEKGEIDGIYESPNQVELLDLTYQNAEIEVRAVNGEITTTYILTPEGESVRGLGYVPLNNVKDVTDRIDTLSQDYPTAEAFVFEVKDTKTTSNMHRAKVGNQKVYLGVNNQPTEYRGAATRYSLFRDKNYDSDQINLTSSVSDLRSGAIDSLSNKASSVKFKQDDSGSGIVLYNKYDYRGKDDVLALTGSDKDITDTDMNDRASSVRIIGQSGKPFVRLYNNKVANKNTNSYGSDYVDVHGYKDISGYFNNKASSFEVIGGEDMNYFTNIQLWDVLGKDDNKLYKQNKDNYIPLQDLDSLNNKVSHVQLICTEDDCPTFKLYKGKDYKNELLYHSISPGFTSMSNNEINEYIDKFDEVSSIKVKNNSDRLSKIIIYKDNGNYAVIDSSISDLSSFKDVIYKGKSSGTRDFNNKIVAIKFYYGVVYRFYTGKNYSGSYQDYIIGEDNIGSDWSNKFSSVRVLNPLPEIGLIAYDETNYGGDFLPVVDDIPDLSAVDFNNKISSVKLITRIPEKRPTHNTTMVVSSKDLSFKTSNKYFGEGTSVNLIGYFERTDQSSKFTPYEHNVKYATTGSYSFDTGINDARGYLVQVDANRVTSNKVRIKLNDTSNSELGTSATHALGLEAGAKFNPKHSNVVFVPAKNNDPSRISVDIEVGAWDDKEDQDGNVPSYNVKVIGYFAEDAASSNDLFYEKFDTPVAVASPSVTDERTSRVTLQTRDFRDEPKGYLVNVTGKHIGGSNFKFSINENYIHLGTAASVNAKGEDPRSVHHSGLMYVKANSIDAYLLEMTPNYGSWIAVDSDAEIDVEVVGYFY
ncbi:hypothetical protein [Bacillus solimangrovi]|uniref:Uncharacterized protein n=1 Tax=Bacillus solimangrovi TaxID=1305675 RepID=A0A1E5LD18_9BACI|nr:hypothetical protein [Bacillus solimangrovi]OEH91960.1 hypothetical protein BFG57_17520 [Bacillus solimangrovi]